MIKSKNDELIIAARNSTIEEFKKIFLRGARPNAIALEDDGLNIKEGYSPLIVAALSGHLEHCKVLVEWGADIHYRAKEFHNITAFIAAAAYGQKDCVEFLLKLGSPIDAVTDDGATALGWCTEAYFQHTEMKEMTVKFLIENSASINHQNTNGIAPIMNFFNGNTNRDYHRVLPFFIEKGADITITDGSGRSVINHATQHSDFKAIEIMMAATENKVLADRFLNKTDHAQPDNALLL